MKKIVRLTLPIVLLVLAVPAPRAQTLPSPGSALPYAAEASAAPLPDAPLPQSQQPSSSSSSSTSQAPQAPPTQTTPAQSQSQTADQQLKQQESQRLLGVVPQFNISYAGDSAVSLTAKQKFSLGLHTVMDPVTFGTAFVVAGYREALDDDIGFRWGPEGYLRRTGASYLDEFDSVMIGNAVLPALFHQDPRYFRLGHGTVRHRILYALATNVICKHDNTGKWEPNYSNVLGNIAAGAISNLYYPPGTSGPGQTLTNALVVTVEGGFGSMFDEFWPDISRHYLHKDPTHGQDAAARAADAAARQSHSSATPPQPSTPQPTPEPPAPK